MANRPTTGPLGSVTCVRGEAFVISDPDGDIRRGGNHGVFLRDTRFLDRVELLIDGQPPSPLTQANTSGSSAVFHSHVPLPGAGPDPVLLLERRRTIDATLREEILLRNHGRTDVEVEVGLRVGSDLAYIFDVRHGRHLDALSPQPYDGGLAFLGADGVDEVAVTLDPTPDRCEGDTLLLRRRVAAGSGTRISVVFTMTDVYGTLGPDGTGGPAPGPDGPSPAPPPPQPWSVRCSDHRLVRLVDRGMDDLRALRIRDPDDPGDAFCAAGSPWYLTLFGRDSLWTALMATPFDQALALGTLRTLARRQGTRHDADTEEAPGKILHEIRRGSLTHRGDLPPNYYGTIDATPLFVILAHEAWSWGLPDHHVHDLLPNIEAALGWLQRTCEQQDHGFLAYHKLQARGLDNQGWKDSRDGVQFADGSLATPPIALAEVQAYAYDAARRGAALLRHLAAPGAAAWETWAADLAARFRARFWLDDAYGRYPATALEGRGRLVDGPASNMGHLLASGLVDDDEAGRIAAQLSGEGLASGWGLRTLGTGSAGYSPLSYHGGSVWPHDTAVAVWGLAVRGQRDAAVTLLRGLVEAAPAFRYRLPELFGGFTRAEAPVPVPYPAACRPQAWAAAGALLLLRACLGLHAEVPGGRVRVEPLWPPPFRSLRLDGLPVAGDRLQVLVDRDRGVEAHLDTGALDLEVVAPDT